MADIYSLLRRKFPESEYALMKEVSDKAGFYRSRSADYIIMNLWPSRGLSLTGFEDKRGQDQADPKTIYGGIRFMQHTAFKKC